VEDKPGEFAKICKLFADNDANLENIGVYHSKVRGVETVVRATGEVSVEKMTEVLKDAGFEVVNVWQTKAEDAVK
ncbi:MAG: ACT domain-containing protein, partial [Lactimicrobium massiliense]